MLGTPLYKGEVAREVCFLHLPYTSHRPPVTSPIEKSMTGGIWEVYGRYQNYTSRLGSPV